MKDWAMKGDTHIPIKITLDIEIPLPYNKDPPADIEKFANNIYDLLSSERNELVSQAKYYGVCLLEGEAFEDLLEKE